MGETAEILALWRQAISRGDKVCLATVVHVEGSSYRKPGARMLVTSSGERAGTISGGCLEAEVSRKAWWLTANGPVVESYQSSFDEDGDGVPWGLGCGGTVWVMLEQDPDAVLQAMAAASETGLGAVVISRLLKPAQTLWVYPEAAGRPELEPTSSTTGEAQSTLERSAGQALAERRTRTLDETLALTSEVPAYFVEYLAPPPRLTIFGAGDDAQPIARFAEALGWRVAVADGRSHLLRRERFAEAAELRLLRYEQGPSAGVAAICGLDEPTVEDRPVLEAPTSSADASIAEAAFPVIENPATRGVRTGVQPGEFAVILTHSFEQDRALLAALLPVPLGYLGILGPRHRTQRLLEEIASELGWSIERCFQQLHSPVGLDLGARDPAAIALSIVAELQAVLSGRQVSVNRPAEAAVHG